MDRGGGQWQLSPRVLLSGDGLISSVSEARRAERRRGIGGVRRGG